ncbi:DEAD/DEAH box helicase [Nibribacter ruber]|uniref:DEAD/DEAH box helicase n=1 Tax=Nibribacter ruber TaxID=2698458 RepID=A0A6P1NTW5_9BACT|nr:DEAD/DEAH box helicase [Nibribacter ruber]QHL86480.1 DEAD/DEAH box helicase [Nibribacter ruber]
MLPKILNSLKITALNEMQEAALAAARTQDMVLLSPTGSGKTLGFLLPLLETLQPEDKGVQALILVPTRELALQIEQVFRQMGSGFRVVCTYGGNSTNSEKRSLSTPPAVWVGTPGRVGHHLRAQNVDSSTITTLVLDEFDKSLEMGFQEEMKFILDQLPALQKRLLTSATNMAEIPAFTGLTTYATVNFLKDAATAPDITLRAVEVIKEDKVLTLFNLLCHLGNKPALVFCNQRDAVENVSDYLRRKGIAHGIFHGGLEQADRERVLLKFRNGTYPLLISTDLAARGLDIPEIENVIHFQMPDAETFLHRNGRTARMQAKGVAYVLLHPGEKPGFLPKLPPFVTLPARPTLPPPSFWDTVYLSAGKKDKVSKGDVVGLLLQKGGLEKDDLGVIEIQENAAFAAVNRKKLDKLVQLLQQEKLKGKKVKVERAS